MNELLNISPIDGRCLDKDRFRKDMGEVSETYDEVSQRVLKLRKK